MGRGGATASSFHSRSPWPRFGTEHSYRCSWNGTKSALGCRMQPSAGEKHHDSPSAPEAKRARVPCRFRTCLLFLIASQRPLDSSWLSLGTGRERRLRACDRQSCGKAGKRPRHCYLCRQAHHHTRGKVTLCFGERSTCGRRHSCGDADMRFLSEGVRQSGSHADPFTHTRRR